MKDTARILLTIVATIAIGLMTSSPAWAATTDRTRLKMWIAPLECTRNEISDGVATTTILTPKQCDDLLHPPGKPQPGKPGKPTPDAPDTGRFSDTWTTIGMAGILSVLGVGVAILVIHDRKLHKSKNLQKKRR